MSGWLGRCQVEDAKLLISVHQEYLPVYQDMDEDGLRKREPSKKRRYFCFYSSPESINESQKRSGGLTVVSVVSKCWYFPFLCDMWLFFGGDKLLLAGKFR